MHDEMTLEAVELRLFGCVNSSWADYLTRAFRRLKPRPFLQGGRTRHCSNISTGTPRHLFSQRSRSA